MNQKKHKKAEGEQRVENVFFPFHHLKKKCNIYIDNWECKCYVQNR